MPAPLGEDARAAAGCPDAARFGQTPGEKAHSLGNLPASGRAWARGMSS